MNGGPSPAIQMPMPAWAKAWMMKSHPSMTRFMGVPDEGSAPVHDLCHNLARSVVDSMSGKNRVPVGGFQYVYERGSRRRLLASSAHHATFKAPPPAGALCLRCPAQRLELALQPVQLLVGEI